MPDFQVIRKDEHITILRSESDRPYFGRNHDSETPHTKSETLRKSERLHFAHQVGSVAELAMPLVN